MDGDTVVYGNPFELTINVKPTVADVTTSNVNYKQIILYAFIASSVLAVLAYGIMISKKKKFN